jgi:proteasome lid subunit RPN8/RPN11
VGEKDFWTIEGGSWSHILRHTADNYPNEACGILLSHCEEPQRITEVRPTENATSEDQTTRYFVDPLEFLDVDQWAEERGLDICGFYHSHPDHPSTPSEYDRKMAWEGYLYLIISIKDGMFNNARAWLYSRKTGHFEEVIFQPNNYEGYDEDSSASP